MAKDWEPIWIEATGTWAIDFYIDGRRIRRRLGIRDRSLQSVARKKAKAIYRQEIERDPAQDRLGTPFWQAAELYVNEGGEARFLPKLIRHFGPDALCHEIGDIEIAAAALELYPDASHETRRRQVRVPARAVLRFAAGERREKRTDNARVRWLTPEEAERLIAACDQHSLPKVAFLLGTGCRTGEMFALDRGDVNTATRQAFIREPKNGHDRWVRIAPRAFDLISWPEEGAAFRTPKGRAYVIRHKGGGQIQGAFNRARDAAELGQDVTPHVLRHTWATWYYAATRDFGGLMDLGGWRKADMANRYRKLAPDDLADRLLAHGWTFGNAPGQDMVNFGKNICQVIENKRA